MRFVVQSTLFSLCVGVSVASSNMFSNVTQMGTAIIAYGTATSSDGVSCFYPGSADSGTELGVYESFDGGNTLEFVDGVGEVAEALLLMAAASRDINGQNLSVIVGGLLGSAISMDGGHVWEKLNIPVMVTQDVKYEKASGLYTLTGTSRTEAAVAISNDGGSNFDVITVSGLYEPYPRYGSFPSSQTFYVTAGGWEETSIDTHLTSRLSISEDGSLKQHQSGDSSYSWAQVAKTTDGGATWSIIYENFKTGYYPNDIHCYDENTCTFAIEGLDLLPRILTTQDGGDTWNSFIDTSGSESLIGVRMTGPTEAFVAGGGDVGRIWHTTDLVNWDEYTTNVTDAVGIFSFALTEDTSTVYATGVLRSEICAMLKLEF
mmetsp:Transcript_16790/g.21794  ORF Transcript_16790/g.21794 Transcript_16790/m.21794 type:complete len:375 (+) Transcript_16790:81-1205(+)